jgi:hypothetical protein
MSLVRVFIGIVICLAALVAGASIALALGGFGICAASFSLGLVGCSVLVGVAFGSIMALVWRKAWWAGALAFSAPALFGFASGASTGQWERVVGIGFSIVGAVFAAFVVRYPDPRSLKL